MVLLALIPAQSHFSDILKQNGCIQLYDNFEAFTKAATRMLDITSLDIYAHRLDAVFKCQHDFSALGVQNTWQATPNNTVPTHQSERVKPNAVQEHGKRRTRRAYNESHRFHVPKAEQLVIRITSPGRMLIASEKDTWPS